MNFELENKKNKPSLYNIDLTNNIHEQTPTEVSKGGTLLHISEELNYKTCKDLHVYKAKELESTFIEIINKKRTLLSIVFITTSILDYLMQFLIGSTNSFIEKSVNLKRKQPPSHNH